ncbi:hypothetical protein [uncultured Cohaesibacter sp.]|uniref:hypothetical protein n=1 Tax=uncultured Cohaesibacter sp. TaxID=1002546 RepID=UPI0029C6210E|nr:hypothetical protein [uncultured Cohaesibacter sp.]
MSERNGVVQMAIGHLDSRGRGKVADDVEMDWSEQWSEHSDPLLNLKGMEH